MIGFEPLAKHVSGGLGLIKERGQERRLLLGEAAGKDVEIDRGRDGQRSKRTGRRVDCDSQVGDLVRTRDGSRNIVSRREGCLEKIDNSSEHAERQKDWQRALCERQYSGRRRVRLERFKQGLEKK